MCSRCDASDDPFEFVSYCCKILLRSRSHANDHCRSLVSDIDIIPVLNITVNECLREIYIYSFGCLSLSLIRQDFLRSTDELLIAANVFVFKLKNK